VDLSAEGLAETTELAGEMRSRLSSHQLNITDLPAVEALPEAVIAVHGAVDGIINNAGIIQRFIPFKDLTIAEIERVMNINYYGAIYMTKVFLPHLLKRPEAHIVNIASMGGFLPVPGQTIYGSSKAAIKLFTEGLHSELMETNVHVTVVFPGATATNITVNSGLMTKEEQANLKSGHKMTPADTAARIIIEAMEKNKYRQMVGQDAKMMDIYYRLMPEKAAYLIYKSMKNLVPK
jgi:short-subunit dehydrogenase